MEQIRHKLIAFEGKAKVSRIKAVMKWWTKCILLQDDDLIVRKPECDEVGSELNANAAVEDVGHNADLYIAMQEDNMQD